MKPFKALNSGKLGLKIAACNIFAALQPLRTNWNAPYAVKSA